MCLETCQGLTTVTLRGNRSKIHGYTPKTLNYVLEVVSVSNESEPCDDCACEIPLDWRVCPHCGRPSRFPNVIKADRLEEVEALERRYRKGLAAARKSGRLAAVKRFEAAVKQKSQAVMVCPATKLIEIANRNRDLFATYHDLERFRFPRPQTDLSEPDWDAIRPAFETKLFDKRNLDRIHYAALSLDDDGLSNYGNCSIVLREDMVSHRASLFNENSLGFAIRRKIQCAQKIPAGYRCSWKRRHQLSVAKTARLIRQGTPTDEFPQLLLKAANTSSRDRFVEVHVFGPMTAKTFEKITLRKDAGTDAYEVRKLQELADRGDFQLRVLS